MLQEKKYKNRELTLTLMVQHPNVVHLHDHYYTAKNGVTGSPLRSGSSIW